MAYGKNISKTGGCVNKACMINTSLIREHTSLLRQQTLVIAMNARSQNTANVGLLIFHTQTKNNIFSK